MEGTTNYAPVLAYIAECALAHEFVLVDIGCSGGFDKIWRSFGPRLRGVGFDPNLAEIERLRAVETQPGIEYVAALATLPESHPFAQRKVGRSDWGRNPWGRLSLVRSLEIVKAGAPLSTSEMTATNRWPEMQLADRAVVVPEYLREHAIENVDFLKMDIDGKDFDVLNSFDSALDRLGVLGLGLELNFFGSAADTDHTLHNTDRFMKARGFELFNLTVRRYSLSALPGQYLRPLPFPSTTKFGRPLQGDALYIRDLGSPEFDDFTAKLKTSKLLNLICIFAAFNLPDCAAEIAVRFRTRLEPLCDVERVLDLLAAQAQGQVEKPLTYREYMERFEAHDAMFFPAPCPMKARLAVHRPQSVLQGLRRMRKAWRALRQRLR